MAQKSEGHGTLVLVVGPSGVGKDSLIGYCRSRLLGSAAIVFPRRVITRGADGSSEDHDSLTEDDFRDGIAGGEFMLHWWAHGLGYGIPAAAAEDLARGRSIVVNVSRSVIEEARASFAPMIVVSVTAPTDLLAERLRQRGREPDERIRERLERAVSYAVTGIDVVTLDNSGPIEQAGEAMLRLLKRTPAITPS